MGYAIAALAALGAAGTLVWWPEAPPSEAPVDESDEPRAAASGDVQQQLDRLRSDVRSLRSRQPTPPADDNAPPAEEQPVDPAPEVTPEQTEAALDTHLDGEVRDPEWSHETEQQVLQVFSDDTFAGVALIEAECRNTMCRVVVDANSEEDSDAFQSAMPKVAPFNTQGFLRVLGDEEAPRVVLYFAREGEDLRDVVASQIN
jgi:hypothetical protein